MSTLKNSNFYPDTDLSNNSVYTHEYEELLVPFWFDNPNVLFHTKYITEFYPVDMMTYNQKLNAITRSVVLITLFAFSYTQKIRVLIVGFISLFSIFIMHYYHVKEKEISNTEEKEGFEPATRFEDLLQNYSAEKLEIFDSPSVSNPFSNVLLPDYEYNVEKKPAPPSFNNDVSSDILEQAKQSIIQQNPGHPDLANKLFQDLGEQFILEQSLQPFYSTPSTTIPNDQEGFSEFCYGSMISCKEGNLFACARNLDRHTN